MKNELLRAAILLTLTGSILTLALLALKPVAKRYFSVGWQRAVCTLALAAFLLPVWLVPQGLRAFYPATDTAAPAQTQAEQTADNTVPPQAEERKHKIVSAGSRMAGRNSPNSIGVVTRGLHLHTAGYPVCSMHSVSILRGYCHENGKERSYRACIDSTPFSISHRRMLHESCETACDLAVILSSCC